jgi:hypothetical protein
MDPLPLRTMVDMSMAEMAGMETGNIPGVGKSNRDVSRIACRDPL